MSETVHKIITVKGKLKPVCRPDSKLIWFRVKLGMVNCRLCLSGQKSEIK